MMTPESKRVDLWQYTTLGLEFVVMFGLFVAGGYWLDGRMNTMPLWTLIGAGVGFVGGLYRLVRSARELDRRSQGKSPSAGPDERKKED
jgi:F0F1-type ATP synthase assembly protein I